MVKQEVPKKLSKRAWFMVLGVLILFAGVIVYGLIGFLAWVSTPVQSDTVMQRIDKPVLELVGGKDVNGVYTLSSSKDKTSLMWTTSKSLFDKTKTKLTINGQNIEPMNESDPNRFLYTFPLKEGENKFEVIAVNDGGKDSKTIVITYTPKPVISSDPVNDAIFEAGVTCQGYAESYFKVKDINVSYDQSSIKRKNADGTIIIKANIADSQGWLHPEKPLGIMECTTDATGMTVISFLSY